MACLWPGGRLSAGGALTQRLFRHAPCNGGRDLFVWLGATRRWAVLRLLATSPGLPCPIGHAKWRLCLRCHATGWL